MSRQPSWIQAFRLILTASVIPLWVGCDGRTVEPPEAAMISISPSSAALRSFGDSVQLSAVVHDQNGQTMPEVAVSWASSEPSVAAINTAGMVTAARNGGATCDRSRRGCVGHCRHPRGAGGGGCEGMSALDRGREGSRHVEGHGEDPRQAGAHRRKLECIRQMFHDPNGQSDR